MKMWWQIQISHFCRTFCSLKTWVRCCYLQSSPSSDIGDHRKCFYRPCEVRGEMEAEVGLRRHQTTAVRQPTLTQRLHQILRNRRLKIGRSKTTTASSMSDSLTLSESNSHSLAHRQLANTRSGHSLFRNNSTNSFQSGKSGFSFRSNKSGRSNVTTLTTLSSVSGSSSSSKRRKRGDDLWCLCLDRKFHMQISGSESVKARDQNLWFTIYAA